MYCFALQLKSDGSFLGTNSANELLQVHSSDFPELWNMTKCFVVAISIASIGVAASVIFLALAKPTIWNAWPAFSASIAEPPLVSKPHLSTPGEVHTAYQSNMAIACAGSVSMQPAHSTLSSS